MGDVDGEREGAMKRTGGFKQGRDMTAFAFLNIVGTMEKRQ